MKHRRNATWVAVLATLSFAGLGGGRVWAEEANAEKLEADVLIETFGRKANGSLEVKEASGKTRGGKRAIVSETEKDPTFKTLVLSFNDLMKKRSDDGLSPPGAGRSYLKKFVERFSYYCKHTEENWKIGSSAVQLKKTHYNNPDNKNSPYSASLSFTVETSHSHWGSEVAIDEELGDGQIQLSELEALTKKGASLLRIFLDERCDDIGRHLESQKSKTVEEGLKELGDVPQVSGGVPAT
jgi:hypothetical protein